MNIGDKVIITHDGMTKEELLTESVANPSIHPATIEFHQKSYAFKKGDKGVIVDLNASGDRWKIKCSDYNEILYVPINYVIDSNQPFNQLTGREIKAPNQIPYDKLNRYLFLAGSIEMGTAEKWQDKVVKELTDSVWTILNPRRDDWDSSWEQTIKNDKFVEQVSWELEAMERAEKIAMYFDPNTKSPITLLELGLWANKEGGKDYGKLIVCCPYGFWRKGNVDIVCARYKVNQVNVLSDIIRILKEDY